MPQGSGPAGNVGIETHLVTDGSTLYQIPLTYRDAPLREPALDVPDPLIATAEHSVLGTRWIYDATADPVWVGELLRLVRTQGVSDPSAKRGVGPAQARGHLITTREWTDDQVTIDLRRVPDSGDAPDHADAVGLVAGTWHPGGPGSPAAGGCLAVVRAIV